MDNQNETNLFEQDSIRKIYTTLALPVTFGMVFSVIYNVADTYFIARTQNTGLVAGVSLCAPVFTLLMAFGNIYGQGGTSLLSRLFGKKDLEGTRRVSSFCFYIAIATGLLIGALMLLFHRPLLYLLGADEETYGYAFPYFMTMAAGAPLVVLNFIHMNLLRAEGMSRESMVGNVAGLTTNIILDPIFISVFGWGAFGAAFASLIGYTVSDVYWLILVRKKSRILSVDPRQWRIPGDEMRQIFGVGISAALTNIMTSISVMLTNQFLLPYGNQQIAAMGIALKVGMIIQLILTGMSFGAAPIVGYFYGGRQYDRLKELLRFLLRIVGGTAIVMTAVLFLLAEPCIRLFMKDETVVAAGTLMLRWHIVTMILAAAILIFTICFQASGKAREALAASICRQGIVYFAVIVLASAAAGYRGVVASQAIADLVSAVLVGWLFRERFWRSLTVHKGNA